MLGCGGRRQLSNSCPEPPPSKRQKAGGLFSADCVKMVSEAVSQLSPVPVAGRDVLELCRKSAVLRVTASHESMQERNHISTRNSL